MENSKKYYITAIVIATIWLLGQPMGGNMSVEVNFDKVPYFNLTNSTVSGSAEISGTMPIVIMLPMLFIDTLSYLTDIEILMLYFIILSVTFLVCMGYYLYKDWRNHGKNY